jgi:hypothetical protein
MYDVAGEKSPIFVESDSFLYNLGDPTIRSDQDVPYIQNMDSCQLIY